MIIGIPRERKPGERRVALTPDGAKELISLGHQVCIETDAGKLSGFENGEYETAGVKIVATLGEVWNSCELLVKVKEPAAEEIQFFRQGLTVFSFLHLAVAAELTKALVKTGVTGLDYDLVMLDDGRLPILEPMSVVAGKLAIQCGAYALQAGNGGRGILLGGTPGVQPGKVVVIGAGAAGANAAKVAIGFGADVTVLDIDPAKLKLLAEPPYRARTLYSTPAAIQRELLGADLVIGSVLIPGALAPKLITRKLLATMRPGSVLVDICIDQGGIAESSKPTTIDQPTFVDTNVVHYCVTNMPALVPRTSTLALTNATFPWIKMLAQTGITETLKTTIAMRRSLTSFKGQLTNQAIGNALKMKFISPQEVDRVLAS